jgi:hypothetical protein
LTRTRNQGVIPEEKKRDLIAIKKQKTGSGGGRRNFRHFSAQTLCNRPTGIFGFYPGNPSAYSS